MCMSEYKAIQKHAAKWSQESYDCSWVQWVGRGLADEQLNKWGLVFGALLCCSLSLTESVRPHLFTVRWITDLVEVRIGLGFSHPVEVLHVN